MIARVRPVIVAQRVQEVPARGMRLRIYLFVLLEQFFHHLFRCQGSKCEWRVKVFNNFVEIHVEMHRSLIENPYQYDLKSSLHNFRATERSKYFC
jgi:hypothetical protein